MDVGFRVKGLGLFLVGEHHVPLNYTASCDLHPFSMEGVAEADYCQKTEMPEIRVF